VSRNGFTLLEVLLVVVILAILASLAFGLLHLVENARITSTEGLVNQLGREAATVAKLKGVPPAALEELIPKTESTRWVKDGRFVDAWDHPIQYRVDGKKFEVWSWGPDGISGTADDLHYVRK
jgi:prepilin-type N-terminal cleavage/methylation domain-containing protein